MGLAALDSNWRQEYVKCLFIYSNGIGSRSFTFCNENGEYFCCGIIKGKSSCCTLEQYVQYLRYCIEYSLLIIVIFNKKQSFSSSRPIHLILFLTLTLMTQFILIMIISFLIMKKMKLLAPHICAIKSEPKLD